MSKTISVNVSQNEQKQIEQYCKDNNINQNDLIKKSIKNEMASSVAHESKQYELPRLTDKEIESKIKESHVIGIEKGLAMTMDHFENNSCPKGNCLICDIKYKQQENHMQNEIDKAMPTIKKSLDKRWHDGVVYGIQSMHQNCHKI